MQQVERPLEHGRGRADAVVPIDLAEHDVAGEDHQFGGRLALVGDRQAVAGLVQAQAAQAAAAGRSAGRRARRRAGCRGRGSPSCRCRSGRRACWRGFARPASRGFSLSRATTSRGLMPQSCRSTSPISPSSRKLLANSSWLGTLGQADVFDRMAERPMAQVVQQGRGDEHLGVFRADGRRRTARRGPVASDTAAPGGTRPGSARSGCGWPPDRPATPGPTG